MEHATLGGLDPFFWPRAKQVAWLSSEISRLSGDSALLPNAHVPRGRAQAKGVRQPFISCDLRRFLPAWAVAHGDVAFEDEPTGLARDLAQAASAALILCLGPAPRVQAMNSGGRKDQPQLLNWAQWHAAYDMSAFLLSPFPALLHHPLAQVDYRRSRHQSVRLGGLSRAQTRRVAGIVTSRVMSPYVTALPSRWRLQPSWVASVGLYYDRIARDLWSERAASGLPGFDLHKAAREVDATILRMAQIEFDRAAKVDAWRAAFGTRTHAGCAGQVRLVEARR